MTGQVLEGFGWLSGLLRLSVWAGLTVCAAEDVRHYRVPNRAAAAGAVCCLLGWFVAGCSGEGVMSGLCLAGCCLGRMVLVLAAGRPFYARRMVGAGDLKLLALLLGFRGIGRGLAGAGAGLVLAAVWSLWRLRALWRAGRAGERLQWFLTYVRPEGGAGGERQLPACLTGTGACRSRPAYYDERRDGYDCVIPLGACLCAGAGLEALTAVLALKGGFFIWLR